MKLGSMFKSIAVAGLASWSLSAHAAASQWEIDTSHSNVGFAVRHMMVGNTRGHFNQFSGQVSYDDKNLAASTIQVTIDTASINTNDTKRDDHLRSPDFFDAGKFPTITFKSTQIEKQGEQLKITGDLTLHGVTKSVVLVAQPLSSAVKDPFGNIRAGTSATAKINRKDFGVVWNKTLDGGGLAVGDDVMLQFDIELVQPKAPAANDKKAPAKPAKK